MESLGLEFARQTRIDTLAIEILNRFSIFRRMDPVEQSCGQSTCPACLAPHLKKVEAAILANVPITFVLPAFPGKSPNQAKVLGHLPDMAEKQALLFLNELCESVRAIYAPGVQIVICSDGRVFSDVVGMAEAHVTAYQNALDQMIQDLDLGHLSTFNLDDIQAGKNFDQLRADLMHRYGQSLDGLRDKVQRGGTESASREDKEAHRMYCGITRFLFEDSVYPGQLMSKTSLQKSARTRAYEVIRRSNAWSELIADFFKGAVRLSIHPQACGSRKLGIQLLGKSTWLTPWHGVAVKTDLGFQLMKRSDAEKLNTRLVMNASGAPSHFQLLEESNEESN